MAEEEVDQTIESTETEEVLKEEPAPVEDGNNVKEEIETVKKAEKVPEVVEKASTMPSPIKESGYQSNFPSLAKYKLVFLGDLGVGKTSIITRFMFDSFEGDYVATIGIDFLSKTIHVNDRTIRLQLWDTAGQERFKTLIPAYIRDSSVAVIVYDVTEKDSFENSKKWIEDARNERNNDILIVLVGNKCDCEKDKRVVTLEEGQELAKEKNTLFIETSAKEGYNVKALFNKISSELPGIDGLKANNGTKIETEKKLNLEPLETQPESNCAC